MRRLSPNTKKGFMLIEVLVVVLIIGILTAFALPQYTKAVEKSLLASILPMVNAIQKELEMFFLSGENSYLDYVGASESGNDDRVFL